MAHPPTFIDPKEAKKYLGYDPVTGQMTLLRATKKLPVGHVFGTLYPNAYVTVSFNGKRAKAHRLAYVLMTGKQPEIMDHINGLKHDNRWENLRSGTLKANMNNMPRHRKLRGDIQKTDLSSNAPQE